jgi:hypothetical protein
MMLTKFLEDGEFGIKKICIDMRKMQRKIEVQT